MPRNAFGAYAPPAGTAPVLPNTLADATKMETRLVDVGNELTGSLPRNGTAPMLANLPMGGKKITSLADATASTEATTLGQVTTLVSSGTAAVATAPGIMADFAGTTPPTGWLLCDGVAVSRATYAALFAVIGTIYGAGDGSTTFNVPDCRGRVAAGRDNMGSGAAGRLSGWNSLGQAGGAQSHTLSEAEMPSHQHAGSTSTNGDHNHSINAWFANISLDNIPGGALSPGHPPNGTTNTAGAHSHTFATDFRGGGQAHNNVQPTIALNKIIKT